MKQETEALDVVGAQGLAPVEHALEEIRDKFNRGEAPVAAPAAAVRARGRA